MLLGAAMLMTAATASAQKRVTGRVVDENGTPVAGASVRIEGHKGAVATDANGHFTLPNVPSSAKRLSVSYIGKLTQQVSITGNANVTVTLHDNDHSLSEAMVVAYGTQKKSTFTGSASIVGTDEIAKVQATNAVDALKGKAAGIQIYTASGQPGSTPTIRIRGVNSLNAGNDPLIVVDGSPFDGSFNDINPADVENMSVLKDASSTALYGARGGNGVVIITTKKGKRGESGRITVDAKWGSNSKATREYKTINSPAGYYEMWYQALYNKAVGDGKNSQAAHEWANKNLINHSSYGLRYNLYNVPDGQYLIGSNGKLNPNATLGRVVVGGDGLEHYITSDDWVDAVYSNGLRQEYTITASNATERGSFYGSVNYLDNEGITVASDYKRLSARLKADSQLKSWLRIGGNMSYAHYNYNNLGNDGSSLSSGNIFNLTSVAPIYPVYVRDAQGNIMFDNTAGITMYDFGDGTVASRPYMGEVNPIGSALLDTRNFEGNSFNATGEAEIRLPLGFKFTTINNIYLHETRSTGVTNPYYGQYADLNGQVSKTHERIWSYNYQQRLDWAKTFGKHSVEAMVGHEYYRRYYYYLSADKSGMFSQSNKELAGAVVKGSADSYTTDYNTESWMARALYNYNEKYFGSASFVREASSRFAKDHRWGNFWSIGGGWMISKESWFHAPFVDYLKLKASYGENGNDNISNYLYTDNYTIENNNDMPSIIFTSKGNPNLTWEKNGKFNVGFDFGFFGERLTGSIEYYSNTTKDMLQWFTVPASLGYTGYYDNIGNVRNNGVELELRGDIIRTRNLTWTVYANITSNHNEITKLPEEKKTMEMEGHSGYSSGSYYYSEGMSVYTMFGLKSAGVDSETGKQLYWKDETTTDANGNTVTTRVKTDNGGEATNYIYGDMMPDAYGGFGTSFEWKGLDISVDFQYQIGGKVMDSGYSSLMSANRGKAMHADLLNAWTTTNTNTDIPRLNPDDSNYSTDFYLTNASYLTLSNFTVGYTLPKSWMKKIGVEKLRFYVVGDNLFTWSKRQGLDPRQSISGSNNSNAYYKPIRTISGGITITL